MTSPRCPLALAVLCVVGLACQVPQVRATGQGPTSVANRLPGAQIEERFETPRRPDDGIDSVAFWPGGGWLIATAKDAGRVNVYDAATGAFLHPTGAWGTGRGQFRRPNGVAVVDDLLVVVERDNARVQVLRLPELVSLGWIGGEVLRRPYGLTVIASGEAGDYELYVTDNYLAPQEQVPPPSQLGERVKHFRFRVKGEDLVSELVRNIGDTAGEGVLHQVESVLADPATGYLLIADEAPGRQDLKVYSLDGRFQGTVVGKGQFHSEPEGIALYACGDQGYWIVTDQLRPKTIFRLFHRRSFEPAGSFVGTLTAHTDGIALTQTALPGFLKGALFAVHDDQSVTAFDLEPLVLGLSLDTDCLARGGRR